MKRRRGYNFTIHKLLLIYITHERVINFHPTHIFATTNCTKIYIMLHLPSTEKLSCVPLSLQHWTLTRNWCVVGCIGLIMFSATFMSRWWRWCPKWVFSPWVFAVEMVIERSKNRDEAGVYAFMVDKSKLLYCVIFHLRSSYERGFYRKMLMKCWYAAKET